MAFARHLEVLPPDHGQPVQPGPLTQHQPRPADRRAARIARPGFGPAEVDHLAGGKIGRGLHIAEAALAAIGDRGRAGYGEGGLAVLPQQQPAGLFGDQRIGRAGEEGERPRFLEPAMRGYREGEAGVGQTIPDRRAAAACEGHEQRR